MNKRIFSGIQPSGNLHLGNYLGAIKQWTDLQNENDALFCIVDLHAITVPQGPHELRKKTLEVAKIYLAAGIDPEKSTLFVQSHVKEHAELAWILNTITKNGDLFKMTQFKSKSGVDVDDLEINLMKEFSRALLDISENPQPSQEVLDKLKDLTSLEAYYLATKSSFATANHFFIERVKNQLATVPTGLFDYPVLMAADILLYDTAVVPVGKDQMQHIELTRTLARRFNERFGGTFKEPEGRLSKEGQLIMGLDDPTKKMSKSAASEYNYIALTDDADTVQKKIRKAVTDSGSEIVYDDEKPALKNLLNIYSLLSGKAPESIASEYVGKGYADFKAGLADTVIHFLQPFQERLRSISDDEVTRILHAGAEKARTTASEKMKEVREKLGLLQ